MSSLHDPGVWMIVALVACLHVTILLGRRFGGPPRWRGLWWLVFLPFSTCLAEGSNTFELLAFVICVGSASYLSVRLANAKARTASVVGAILLVIVLGMSSSVLASTSDYMIGPARWDDADWGETPEQVVYDLNVAYDNANETFGEAGYLDESRFSWLGVSPRGPFTRAFPERLWHTEITGFSRRKTTSYALWVPRGLIKTAIKHARLVALVNGVKPPMPANGVPGFAIDGPYPSGFGY
jgi:hypothetical protein